MSFASELLKDVLSLSAFAVVYAGCTMAYFGINEYLEDRKFSRMVDNFTSQNGNPQHEIDYLRGALTESHKEIERLTKKLPADGTLTLYWEGLPEEELYRLMDWVKDQDDVKVQFRHTETRSTGAITTIKISTKNKQAAMQAKLMFGGSL